MSDNFDRKVKDVRCLNIFWFDHIILINYNIYYNCKIRIKVEGEFQLMGTLLEIPLHVNQKNFRKCD